jgi:hypothetical protein
MPGIDCINLEYAVAEAWDAVATETHTGIRQPSDVQPPERAFIHPVVRISRGHQNSPRLSFIPTSHPSEEHHESSTSESGSTAPSIYPSEDNKSCNESIHSARSKEGISCQIVSADELAALTSAHPLPKSKDPEGWMKCRYLYLSYYRRLWALIIATNTIAITILVSRAAAGSDSLTYEIAATASGANLFGAALARHEHFVNLLFRLACCLPLKAPMWIRSRAAKVYTYYGGIHAGCGVSALLWYVTYTVLVARQFRGTQGQTIALTTTTASTLILLIIIISTAHPHIRRSWHNQWELAHRFCGWTAIALVWTQTLIIAIATAHATSQPLGETLATTPTFYFLLAITLLMLYPWLRLRKRTVSHAEKLSSHAVRLHFDDRDLPTCVGYRLASSPLLENHGFATIPNTISTRCRDEEEAAGSSSGYSILISNAGDWTSSLINTPPAKIWFRGAPTLGVMKVASLFDPIVVIATGSGIGPCLSFLQARPDWPVRIIWSARHPEETYGNAIMQAVLKADKEAMVIDTKSTGHPDLPAIAWARVQEGEKKAEAIIIISNPKVTEKVVFEMERRGVPAFGAIFDS